MPHCLTSSWHVVDDLRSTLRCPGCMESFTLRPNPPWSCRLNKLVENALRRHGIVSVLRTLEALSAHPRSFLFLPSQNIYQVGTKGAMTDLDILVIADGRVFIGEVKSSPGAFDAADFQNIQSLAEDMLPDEVVIASVGTTWPAEVRTQLTSLAGALAPLQIKVSDLLLE